MLQQVKTWLEAYLGELSVDYVDSGSPSTGLYPRGLRRLWQTRDILGNTTERYRCQFTIRRVVSGMGDKTVHALWLLDLQNWVRQSQDAPALGEDTQWYAENGKCIQVTQAGTGIYTLELYGEFTKKINGGT